MAPTRVQVGSKGSWEERVEKRDVYSTDKGRRVREEGMGVGKASSPISRAWRIELGR